MDTNLRCIKHFTTSEIWLDLADYYRAGLHRTKVLGALINIDDPGRKAGKLLCRRSAGDMIIVGTSSNHPDVHALILADIYDALEQMVLQPTTLTPRPSKARWSKWVIATTASCVLAIGAALGIALGSLL